MTSLKFIVVPHTSYSPDLAPSDFWLFSKLKEALKGHHLAPSDFWMFSKLKEALKGHHLAPSDFWLFSKLKEALKGHHLAPSDFWLFSKLKEALKGHHFSTDAEVEAAVCKWISSQPENSFIDGMKKWRE